MSEQIKDTIRILLFEDDDTDAKHVENYLNLSKLDYSLTRVRRLAEGVKQLQKQPFDVILLDLDLPDSRGIETLGSIIGATSRDEVIILLAEASSNDDKFVSEALLIGAQDYLLKDRLNSEVLSRSIRYAVELAKMKHTQAVSNSYAQQQENLLRRIFDTNIDAILVLSQNYEIKFFNSSAADLLEARGEELLGETFPFTVINGESTELEIPDSNNQTHIVELSAVDLIWEGEVAMLVNLRDVTQCRKAEAALKYEREWLSVTLDSITEAAITSDQNGIVERLNQKAAQLIGASGKDLVGQPLVEILKFKDPKTGEAVKASSSMFMSSDAVQESVTHAISLDRSHDESHSITAETRCILDDEGKHHGCVTILHDVSRQKKAENELFEAEKLNSLSLLVGGIAHDFNNMLTAILGNISILRMELQDNEQYSNKLIAAETATLQARSLTDQLLAFSKGSTPLLEVTTISDIVEECAQFVLRGSNVKCEIEKVDELWQIYGNKGQISQVVNNLIINADQSMPAGGTIKIRLRNLRVRNAEVPRLSPGDYICIEVHDHGTGISQENLKKIFNPYFTTKENGNGLGLASSYSIIESHEGTITADSSVGHGSTFRVYIPKAKQSTASKDTASTVPAREADQETIHRGKGRILVMDDMEAMMKVAGEILNMLGYEVEYSTNGEEAIAAYKAAMEAGNPFDAAVFDLTVPGGMGGEEAANILKEYDPNLTAIASSGYTTSNVMSDYKDSAFKAVVPKPYRIKEMSDVLHRLLKS
jgi:PAS domain S-box-containing protein